MMVAMAHLDTQDPVAVATVEAIRSGDVGALRRLLDMYPDLTTVRLGDPCGMSRTLLHVATDWPGHFPNGPQMIEVLVEAGADVNGRFAGSHTETPLHWAASSDDVAALDALLDAGADIEATGAVIGGGTAISDACAFAQWNAARRLIERGAGTLLWEAAALGLMDRVRAHFAAAPPPTPEDITHGLWSACHGGRREATEFFLQHGGDIDWVGHDRLTPLDATRRAGADGLAAWLRDHGARSADELD
jgi:ankyrin repeat protein